MGGSQTRNRSLKRVCVCVLSYGLPFVMPAKSSHTILRNSYMVSCCDTSWGGKEREKRTTTNKRGATATTQTRQITENHGEFVSLFPDLSYLPLPPGQATPEFHWGLAPPQKGTPKVEVDITTHWLRGWPKKKVQTLYLSLKLSSQKV